METVAEKLLARRLARMRQGQAIMEVSQIPSDPEMRVAVIPLLEAEYDQALSVVVGMEADESNIASMTYRDRIFTRELLVRALRVVDNPDVRVFESVDHMVDTLETTDIDHLIDVFNELTASANPSIDGIPAEEFDFLRRALQEIPWSDLSGRSWYAAKRFLGALISDGLLRDNSPGLSSTSKSTTKSESEESTPAV